MSALDKLLPMLTPAENKESFFRRIAIFYPTLDPRYKAIQRAYKEAKEAFREDEREDGIRYFEHLRAVALILQYLRVGDYRRIIAALLHDIVEDHPDMWPIERVEEEFGHEVALLVEYCTKPSLEICVTKEEQDRIYHTRFREAPRDFFLIKLSDRLHNVLTLDTCSLEKRQRKIAETKEHYMPYAEEHFILFYELEEALARVSLV
ncbi:MAG: HD domain-containing protein [Candidatus Yonathbacteria bacterium]|nr:HD domain-containing protein [Candidatus Yonathbacteria bacterium]